MFLDEDDDDGEKEMGGGGDDACVRACNMVTILMVVENE